MHGQTFQEWFRDTCKSTGNTHRNLISRDVERLPVVVQDVFDYQGTSPLVSGFYFDDDWPAPVDGKVSGFPDPFANMSEDMGLTAAEQMQIHKSYQANMATVYAEILKRGMFSWQQQWNGQASPTAKNGCCTGPLVNNGSSCAPTLRKLCAADSPTQTRVMNYAFSPGSCKGGTGLVPLTAPVQDIANFLLVSSSDDTLTFEYKLRFHYIYLATLLVGTCTSAFLDKLAPHYLWFRWHTHSRPRNASLPDVHFLRFAARTPSSGTAGSAAPGSTRCRSKSTGTTASPSGYARRRPQTPACSRGSGPKPRSPWTATRGPPPSPSSEASAC